MEARCFALQTQQFAMWGSIMYLDFWFTHFGKVYGSIYIISLLWELIMNDYMIIQESSISMATMCTFPYFPSILKVQNKSGLIFTKMFQWNLYMWFYTHFLFLKVLITKEKKRKIGGDCFSISNKKCVICKIS